MLRQKREYAGKSKAYYSPFGSPMTGRHYETNYYRYGMNGQEKDDELGPKGTSLTAEFWEYEARLGRRWNMDPKPMDHISVYACFDDNPIWHNDPNGDIVKYKGLREFLNVTFARLSSKAFNKEFKVLKKSKDVYTYNNTLERGGDGGDVTQTAAHRDGHNDFRIDYTTRGEGTRNAVGHSRYSALFEETYHSSDYIKGTSGLIINEIGQIASPDLGTQQVSEGRAWIFSARYAPFQNKKPIIMDNKLAGTNEKVQVLNPLTSQLKVLDETNNKDVAKAAKLLFNGFKTDVLRKEHNDQKAWIQWGHLYP